MFETIDDDIEKTEGGHTNAAAWLLRFAIIGIVLLVFGAALYFAID